MPEAKPSEVPLTDIREIADCSTNQLEYWTHVSSQAELPLADAAWRERTLGVLDSFLSTAREAKTDAGARIRAVALADYEPYDRRESPQESLSLLAGQAGSLERGPGAAPMTPSAVRAAKAAGMAAGVMSLPKPRSTDGPW